MKQATSTKMSFTEFKERRINNITGKGQQQQQPSSAEYEDSEDSDISSVTSGSNASDVMREKLAQLLTSSNGGGGGENGLKVTFRRKSIDEPFICIPGPAGPSTFINGSSGSEINGMKGRAGRSCSSELNGNHLRSKYLGHGLENCRSSSEDDNYEPTTEESTGDSDSEISEGENGYKVTEGSTKSFETKNQNGTPLRKNRNLESKATNRESSDTESSLDTSEDEPSPSNNKLDTGSSKVEGFKCLPSTSRPSSEITDSCDTSTSNFNFTVDSTYADVSTASATPGRANPSPTSDTNLSTKGMTLRSHRSVVISPSGNDSSEMNSSSEMSVSEPRQSNTSVSEKVPDQEGPLTLEGLSEEDRELFNKIQLRGVPSEKPSSSNVVNSSGPDSYFTAEIRTKYKNETSKGEQKKGKELKSPKVVKKPRKGNRTGREKDHNLAERPDFAFSVTKEFAKLLSNSEGIQLPQLKNKHEEETEQILENIKLNFANWIYYIFEGGFNIMMHGYGSKLPVFDAFRVFLDKEFRIININGLNSKLTAKKFVTTLCDALDLEDLKFHGTNVDVITSDFCEILKRSKYDHVFILVNNFDVMANRSPQLFNTLASLSVIEYIHIVASSDHVNAFLGVDVRRSSQLKFFWVECHTFMPYIDELKWEPDVFGEDEGEETGKNTLEHVLRALTTNSKNAFCILGKLQILKMKADGILKAKDFSGVAFKELEKACREGFIAHSTQGVQSLLSEFVDHKIIRYTGKTKSSTNFIVIDLEISTIEQVISELSP